MKDFAYIAGSDDSVNLADKARLLINPRDPSFLWEKARQWALFKDVISLTRKQRGVVPNYAVFAMLSFARTRMGFFQKLPMLLATGFGWLTLSPPALNDYHIARWCLTGDDADLKYVCDRALLAPRNSDGSGVVPTSLRAAAHTSAAWAVAAIAPTSHEFHLAVLRLYPAQHTQLLTPYSLPPVEGAREITP